MALFLSPYLGSGTREDPFRPRGLDIPGASAIDVRLDSRVADGGGIGFAVLWVPSGFPDPSGTIQIADDYGDPLTAPQRNRLNRELGLDFSRDTTIQEALETVLFRADLPGEGTWKSVRPTNGRYEAWLGSGTGKRKWLDVPLAPAGGSISDNFNRANETPIAAPWTKVSGGNINLSGNAITTSGSSCAYYYAHGSGWNADQTSQLSYISANIQDDWSPGVRMSSGWNGYFYDQYSGTARQCSKVLSGSWSAIEAASGTASTGNTYKIEVAGSTIRYYDNGVENANSPATDTSLATAGSGAGLVYWQSGGSLDNFLATGEVSSGAAIPVILHHRQQQRESQ